MSENAFKAALKQGDSALIGLWVACADAYVASIAGGAGFDWLVIDGEHAPNDLRSIVAQLLALQSSPAEAVVRPPVDEPWMLKQLLDAGARTLLVPMVDTPEQAAAVVRAVRYPPKGIRGMGAALGRVSDFGRRSDYATRADDDICLLVQAETPTAISPTSPTSPPSTGSMASSSDPPTCRRAWDSPSPRPKCSARSRTASPRSEPQANPPASSRSTTTS